MSKANRLGMFIRRICFKILKSLIDFLLGLVGKKTD